MKKIMFIMTLAVALFLTACSQQEKATQTSSKQTSASSQTVTSASEEQKEGVSIDGSIDPVNQSMRIGDEPYRYRIEGDQLSLEDLEQAERMIKGLLF